MMQAQSPCPATRDLLARAEHEHRLRRRADDAAGPFDCALGKLLLEAAASSGALTAIALEHGIQTATALRERADALQEAVTGVVEALADSNDRQEEPL